MAEHRYSERDQQKIVRDQLAELRARGVDAQDMHAVHPGGAVEAVKALRRDLGYTRDQSQEQVERSREVSKR